MSVADGSVTVAPAEQLLLKLGERPAVTFASFFVSADNEALMHALQSWLAAPQSGVFLLVGALGSGRSHLLQAATAAVAGALYLPLAELRMLDPDAVLDGLEAAPLLCLDDVDAVSADRHWCEALFHLFNRQIGSPSAVAGKWLVSAAVPAGQLACALPDLQSRLSWGGGYRLAPLDDGGRLHMLQLQARQRGMDLPDEVATYILQRFSRQTPDLLALLERIDRESLLAKQRITVAFVRKLLHVPI